MSIQPTTDLNGLAESKGGWKDSIPTGSFLGYVLGLICFLILGNHVKWFDWTDAGFLTIVWSIVFAFILLYGWTKPSLMKVTKIIANILYDPSYKQQTKFGMLSTLMWTIFGVAVNLSQNEEKTGLTSLVQNMGNKIKEIDNEPKPFPISPMPAPASKPAPMATPPAPIVPPK